VSRSDLTFTAGFAIFLTAAVIYAFVSQGTTWAQPTLIVGGSGIALSIAVRTRDQ
jgi:hypothetical protein